MGGRREGRKEGEGEGRERGRGEEGREGSVGGLNVKTYTRTPCPVMYTHFSHRCLQQLGRNHGYLVSTLVPELLSTHPFFMGKEPDVDDPACIPLHPHCHVPWLWGTRDYRWAAFCPGAECDPILVNQIDNYLHKFTGLIIFILAS